MKNSLRGVHDVQQSTQEAFRDAGGREKVELPRAIDEPRSKKHPSQRDRQRRRVTHLSCGYVSTSPLSHRKSGFLNQAHPTATGSNEVIRFTHGPSQHQFGSRSICIETKAEEAQPPASRSIFGSQSRASLGSGLRNYGSRATHWTTAKPTLQTWP